MELADILVSEAVAATQSVSSKKRLLLEIAEQAEALNGLSKQKVFEALQERELLGATGMGKGIAVPHARMADVDRVIGFFTRLEEGVNFDSVDGQPVDLVFTLLAPEDAGADHLKALARVSRTLRDDATCRKLRSTNDAAALFAILTETAKSEAA